MSEPKLKADVVISDYRCTYRHVTADGRVKTERTAQRPAWGIFDAGGELIDVRLTPETTLPNRPKTVKLVQIHWKED
jgi:hypothetical protein